MSWFDFVPDKMPDKRSRLTLPRICIGAIVKSYILCHIVGVSCIGLLPEFYACYKMLNVKNHHVFNEKFVLNVLDLKRIDLATEEDRRYEIDCWARMFKAGTWEELRMIAEKNKYMSEAAMAMYELNADEIIRQQCMAREEYNRYEKMMARKLAEANEQLAEARKDVEVATRQLEQERSNYEAEIARLQELIAQKQN